jgi:hypothetical protein
MLFVLNFFTLDFFLHSSKKFLYILFFYFFYIPSFNFFFLTRKKILSDYKFFGLKTFKLIEIFKENINIFFFSFNFFPFFSLPPIKIFIFSFFSASLYLFLDYFTFFFLRLSCHFIFFTFYNSYINYFLHFSFDLRISFIVSFNVVEWPLIFSHRVFIEESRFAFFESMLINFFFSKFIFLIYGPKLLYKRASYFLDINVGFNFLKLFFPLSLNLLSFNFKILAKDKLHFDF